MVMMSRDGVWRTHGQFALIIKTQAPGIAYMIIVASLAIRSQRNGMTANDD